MNIRGFYEITRPANSIISGCAAAVGYLIATGTLIPGVLLIIAIVILMTAAGNVINDYFDAGIDAINRPARPIPSGIVSKGSALVYATTLFLAGITLSLLTKNGICILIAAVNSLLLIGYAAKLKSTPFIGNITVSYLSASIFLFGGALAGIAGLLQNLPLALITFLAMVARELLKDAEDVEGDSAGGASTLPLHIGIRTTTRLAFAFALLAICASLIPGLWWGRWYIMGIGIVDLVILASVSCALSCITPDCVKASQATTFLKAGMFASLVVFTLAALLLK
jgi:geranylgeranylglycerol-phosphate geranylgeranyltransferase